MLSLKNKQVAHIIVIIKTYSGVKKWYCTPAVRRTTYYLTIHMSQVSIYYYILIAFLFERQRQRRQGNNY